ncbi:MAG: DUF1848 domain-containing protein [Lachnospiraceae bacterium]|nr:DUF1848 domain-containing protein [Lachnospiraceae bacterium]
MIINTGQRTDIPAFYSDWFFNRLEEGYVLVRNPYDGQMISRYRLDPSVVDLIGFCTKNPKPMLGRMDRLKGYGQFWYVTITCYGRDIEPNVPPVDEVTESFAALSEAAGIDNTGWRYDPILINEEYTVERHLDEFSHIASRLSGYTRICVISFIDIYGKVSRNFPEAVAVSMEDREYLGKRMTEIAGANGMELRPCHEGTYLSKYGADCSGCMTVPVYERAVGARLAVPYKKPSREGCACYLSCDIGEYDTCGHLCRYCYANSDPVKVRINMSEHDPDSPLLIGRVPDNAKIHEVPQKSWIDGQLSFL